MKSTTDPVSQTPPTRAVRLAALVVVPVIIVAMLGALAEAAVRARQWSRLGTAASLGSLYRVDDRLDLRVLTPSVRVGHIGTNAAGFRGPEIVQPKPAGTVRLAFLGASTTFCAEVSGDAAVWPQLVTEALARRFPSARFDFVNGGVPGYSVDSSRKNLRHRVAPLQPDVVVVYHATNDLSGEVRGLAAKAGLIQIGKEAQPGWLERHSLLWELVTKNIRVLYAQRGAEQASSGRLEVDASSLGRGFREDLGGLLREASAVARHVAVATFSTQLRREQTVEQRKQAAVSAMVYMPFMTLDGLLDGYARYNQLIIDAAGAEGAQLIGGEMSIPGDAAHFVDTVHFSDAGSRKMAQRVADALAADPKFRALVAAGGAVVPATGSDIAPVPAR